MIAEHAQTAAPLTIQLESATHRDRVLLAAAWFLCENVGYSPQGALMHVGLIDYRRYPVAEMYADMLTDYTADGYETAEKTERDRAWRATYGCDND